MAPTDDQEDYYALLGISATASDSEIRRAYRKTSLLYHPDKAAPTPENLAKFQLLQTAIAVLSDAAEKTQYDQKRDARLRRQAETAAMEGRRRQMKEDLERREASAANVVNGSGTKRSWSEREMEIKRIQEENRKKREAMVARKMQEFKAAEEAHAAAAATAAGDDTASDLNELQRAVKVRWVREGDGLEIDDVTLTQMFPAGDVETVVIQKDKKRKLAGRDKKVVMGTAVLVFKTLAAAKKAVSKGKIYELESVEWAVAEKDNEPS